MSSSQKSCSPSLSCGGPSRHHLPCTDFTLPIFVSGGLVGDSDVGAFFGAVGGTSAMLGARPGIFGGILGARFGISGIVGGLPPSVPCADTNPTTKTV